MKIIEVIASHQSSTEKQEAKRKKRQKQLRAMTSHIRLSCYR